MDAEQIKKRLEETFPQSSVQVTDLRGGDHWRVEVVSTAFEGKSLLEQHRMVYQPFAEELGGSIHAFSIQTSTPK